MPQKLVTVDQTNDLPQVVKERLAEFFPTLLQAKNIADASANQTIAVRSSIDAQPEKLVIRGATGFFDIKDAVNDAHPVTLAQLNTRIPSGGYPVASQLTNGLMSSTDKSKLDASNYSALADAIARRNSTGAIEFSDVRLSATQSNAVNSATRKDYVDTQVATRAPSAHKHDAGDTDSGVFSPARLPLATSSANGALLATDKDKLDKASSLATAGTLMMADANGRYQSANPSAGSDVANKTYVDGKKWSGADITSGLVDPARIANVTSSLDGLMSKTDKALLDGAGAVASANRIIKASSTGDISVNTPTNASHPTTKGYVDGKTWSGADITSGLIDQARIANATSSLNGLMSSTDKVKLDGATALSTGGTITLRDANGNARFSTVLLDSTQSTFGHSVARKDYVDGLIAKQVTLAGDLNGVDLNTVITPGDYYQSVSSGASLLNNFPIASGVGTLSVRRFHSSSVWVVQTYQVWNSNRTFVRSTNSSTGWTAWTELANTDYVDGKKWSGADITSGTISPLRIANATSSLDGLMSKTDKARLDGASASATANTIMMTDSGGRYSAVSPTATTHVANKAYVDGKTWDGSDITTGLINQARIANATASLNGLMSSTDKAKLDGAGYNAGANTIAMTNSSGYLKASHFFGDENVAQSALGHALTRKEYVDGKLADLFVGAEIPDNTNLNNYTTPGYYHNSTNASIATGSNYPSATAGLLEVFRNPGSTMVYQFWTEYSSASSIYYRTRYNGAWYAWKELVTTQNSTRHSMGELPGLSNATATGNLDNYKTAGTYIVSASGSTSDGGILEVFVASNGDICQRMTIQGAMNGGNQSIRWFNIRSGTVRTWSSWSSTN